MARATYRNGKPRKNAPSRQPSNRTDILTPSAPAQPVMVPTGGPYGSAQQLTRAQQSAPLPTATPPGQPPPDLMSLAGNAPGAAAQPLTRPTERPGEPVTAGASIGPGPGPTTIGMGTPVAQTDPIDVLRALVAQHPDIPELVAMLDEASPTPKALLPPPNTGMWRG